MKPGNSPFAAANALALNKLRMCVIGLKTVFANCDVAFGYKIKFAYTFPKEPRLSIKFLPVCSSAFATPVCAYKPFNGLVTPASSVLPGSKSIRFMFLPNAANASASLV